MAVLAIERTGDGERDMREAAMHGMDGRMGGGPAGRLMAAAGLLMLAACNPSPESSAPDRGMKAKPKVEQSDFSRRLAALNDEQRNAVFFRAIREAGLQCQDVTASEPVMPDNRYPTWRAHCGDASAHLIQILPDGTANIVSRAGPQD